MKRPTPSNKKYQIVDLLVNWFRITSRDHQGGISAKNFEGRTVSCHFLKTFPAAIKESWFFLSRKNHYFQVEVYKVEFFKVTRTKQDEKRVLLKGRLRKSIIFIQLFNSFRDELREHFWTMIRDYPNVFGNIFSNVFDDFYTAYTMRTWDLPGKPTITQVLSQIEVSFLWQY